ncbi:hypothetical protein [Kitasatospora griseola]|uniref:hypothetical protein n=1 Tax=Kitasatospora griseola TaxID=2064 RepID=UPI00166F8F9E|nr:hypothetical protein [Kitasatospora griseola]
MRHHRSTPASIAANRSPTWSLRAVPARHHRSHYLVLDPETRTVSLRTTPVRHHRSFA